MLIRKLLIAIVVVFLLSAANAMADTNFGLNADWNKFEKANSGDWGVGARVDFGSSVRGIVSFDYFFVNADDLFDEDDLTSEDFDLKFWEVNGNVVYAIKTESVTPYFGGGIGFARRTFDGVEDFFNDERTELGFNVLGGLKFGEAVQPFIEVRGTFYGDEGPSDDLPDIGDLVEFADRFVISGGILF